MPGTLNPPQTPLSAGAALSEPVNRIAESGPEAAVPERATLWGAGAGLRSVLVPVAPQTQVEKSPSLTQTHTFAGRYVWPQAG